MGGAAAWGCGATLVAIAWGGLSAVLYRRAFGAGLRARALPPTTPVDFGMAHETLDVRTRDGLRLVAWYLPGSRPAAVVVSGGYRGRAGDVLGISGALNRMGFHVVVYGWRGTPGSDRAGPTLGVHERRDLTAALDALWARLGPVPAGLLGFSLGGAVSIGVAAADERVRAVCSDSAFADPRRILADGLGRALHLPASGLAPVVAATLVAPAVAVVGWRRGARLGDFRPLEAVGRLPPRPLLLIHGTADRLVPVAHALRLFAAAREPKELWLLPGVGHVGAYWVDRDAYVRRVAGFFESSLLGEGSLAGAPGIRGSRTTTDLW